MPLGKIVILLGWRGSGDPALQEMAGHITLFIVCCKTKARGTMRTSSPTNHVQCSQHTARQNSSAVAFTPILYKGKYAFQHVEKKSDLYFPVNRALHFYVMLTKPAKTGELNASCRAAFESNIILL